MDCHASLPPPCFLFLLPTLPNITRSRSVIRVASGNSGTGRRQDAEEHPGEQGAMPASYRKTNSPARQFRLGMKASSFNSIPFVSFVVQNFFNAHQSHSSALHSPALSRRCHHLRCALFEGLRSYFPADDYAPDRGIRWRRGRHHPLNSPRPCPARGPLPRRRCDRCR